MAADIFMNCVKGCVHDVGRNVIDVRSVHQVQDQAPLAPSHQIFGMFLGGGSSSITQRLPVIGLLAGMNEKPARLAAHLLLIELPADKQIPFNFNHAL